MPTPRTRPAIPARDGIQPEDTAAQRQRLQAAADKEQADRARELTMASAQKIANDRDGVYDAHDGALVEAAPEAAELEARAAERSQIEAEDGVIEGATVAQSSGYAPPMEGAVGPNGVPILTSEEDPDSITEAEGRGDNRPDMTPRQMLVPDSPRVGSGQGAPRTAVAVKKEERRVVVRINATITPTIGQGPDNTYSFEEGRRYRVPEHIAAHLDEKGYVSQWG